MSPQEQDRLVQNIAGSLGKCPQWLQEKMVAHFTRADEAYGAGLAKALGLK